MSSWPDTLPQKPVTIYALIDPRTDQIRYVGASRSPVHRYQEHTSKRAKNTPAKKRWMSALQADGYDPLMIKLDRTTIGNWGGDPRVQVYEELWVRKLRDYGLNLLNKQKRIAPMTVGEDVAAAIPWEKIPDGPRY